MHLLYISVVQLSKYKTFIGHSIFNSVLLSSWLIFSIRGKTTILNLFHTIKMLKMSYKLIRYIVSGGFPLWYINFDLTKEEIIKKNAQTVGEFFLTRKWIRGLISNYYVITKAFRKYLVKKQFMEVNKVKDIYDKWFFTRFTWPRGIFISSANTSYIVSKEAASVKVPTIALVDTNIKTLSYNIPIACNDDSLDSIAFMNHVISFYIIQCKYKKVLVWYYFNRNISRFKTLVKWSKNLIQFKKKLNYKINLKNFKLPTFLNYYKDITKGLNFFFLRSYNFKLLKKYNIPIIKNSSLDNFYRRNKILLYHKFKSLKYKRLARKYKIKYKRSVYLDKIRGVALFKSFLNNFIRLRKKTKRYNRIKVKKRRRLEKKKISRSFSPFFYFLFIFYLNKFNIVIDFYRKKMFYLQNIIKLKVKNKKNLKNIQSWRGRRKEKDILMFRLKSKKIYKRKKKRKYHNFNIYNKITYINYNRMSFLFFYWKYYIMFFGLKISNKNHNFKKKYNLENLNTNHINDFNN